VAEVTVITSAVRDEAKKWRDLSDKLAPVKSTTDGLVLSQSAFFIGDVNAGMHSDAYEGFRSFMSAVLAGGVTEFEQVGDALDKIADAYDKSDAIAELDLNKIYSANPR
jgi:hypothetical protein